MKLNWDDKLSELVASRVETLLADPNVPARFREAARITNALPVYPDWTCVLCITPDGGVLCYDDDSGTISLADENWSISAAVFATDKYPELSRMLPERPPAANDCSACAGVGEFPLPMGHIA